MNSELNQRRRGSPRIWRVSGISLSMEALQREWLEVDAAPAFERQLRERLADPGRMLEAMPGARRGDDHVRHARMASDREVEVRGCGVEAGDRLDAARADARKVWRDEVAVHLASLLFGHVAGHFVRLHRVRILLGRDLDARPLAVDRGKPVDDALAVLQLPDPDRESRRGEVSDGTRRLEPVQHLACDAEVPREIGVEELGKPGARGDDDLAGAVLGGIGAHANDAALVGNRPHALVAAKLRAVLLRERELGAHARLGIKVPRAGLVVSDLVVSHVALREVLAQLARIEPLVLDIETARRGERVVEEVLDVRGCPPRAARDDEAAGDDEELRARLRLDVAPDLVRAAHDRRVVLALADRDARDAGVAVRRAKRVGRREAVDAEHLRAALGRLVGARRADRSQSHDDEVVHETGVRDGFSYVEKSSLTPVSDSSLSRLSRRYPWRSSTTSRSPP